jgi:RNA polymerase sigma-70 factor (ECF subfamily)
LRVVASSDSSDVVSSDVASAHVAPSDPALDLGDFDAVYRRYAPYVATIGLRILGRPADVEDLVQEVFLVVHGSLDSLKSPEKIRGWLKTITVRKAVCRLRRARLRRMLALEDVPSYEKLVDPSASPEQQAEVERLYTRLDQLSTKDRIVFVLRHVEEHTLDEVAEHSGLSKSTVQRRLRNAEALLELGGLK